ncbi:MAG: hypothetical protein N3E51_02485 [Candidatus Micrarchaeota archaeon]|nr:hypothetical protein [Candidatus Micrarchaeota archaeon]
MAVETIWDYGKTPLKTMMDAGVPAWQIFKKIKAKKALDEFGRKKQLSRQAITGVSIK